MSVRLIDGDVVAPLLSVHYVDTDIKSHESQWFPENMQSQSYCVTSPLRGKRNDHGCK